MDQKKTSLSTIFIVHFNTFRDKYPFKRKLVNKEYANREFLWFMFIYIDKKG